MKYPSHLLESAVNEFASLPGIGRKTALRLALHMLRRDPEYTERFTSALLSLRRDIRYCRLCHNISDDELCPICANPSRDHSVVCVVENVKEIMAIENTGQFRGVYHVLGGIISPMEGIGPADLEIDSLVASPVSPRAASKRSCSPSALPWKATRPTSSSTASFPPTP